MMTRFAAHTTISADKSIGEIRRTILRYGGTAFAQGEGASRFAIQFAMKNRIVKFLLPIPDRDDKRFLRDGRGSVRTTEKRFVVWDQECRSRYRALALAIKAKLEAVETNITTFEEEFYAHIVMPNGKTIYELTSAGVDEAYRSQKMPKMLMPGIEL